MITNGIVEKFGNHNRYCRVIVNGNKFPGLFVIDTQDLWVLNGHVWSINRAGYVVCTIHRNEQMHRLILSAQIGQVCDHKNRDTKDNRRKNLRLVTHSDNMKNRGPQKNSKVPIKGVYLARNKWRAEINSDGRRYRLGTYEYLYDAVCARIRKEIELYGDKSLDYKPILKHIPANYLKFWFPEIYGKDNTRNIGDEFVNSFFTHKKDGLAGMRYRMVRYRKKARNDARFIRKKDIGIL